MDSLSNEQATGAMDVANERRIFDDDSGTTDTYFGTNMKHPFLSHALICNNGVKCNRNMKLFWNDIRHISIVFLGQL